MGLFNFLKGQFIDVIEWTNSNLDTIVYRFPVMNKEIKMGAKLTVRESQVALFVNEGQIADVFAPGLYELTTENLPILTKLKSWKYGFNSPFKAEVYFVNTRQFTEQNWGKELVHYTPEFLSGFYAECYGISHVKGFESAKEQINDIIYSDVVDKIDADEVRNVDIDTSFKDIKFKHILLPIWVSSYKFKNKVYKYYINGQTGEIQGEAPTSGWKVLFTTLIIAAIIFGIYKLIK
ncbi:SPFH domain-containing protein [Clostridium butanoliproducens]|uniref:SPFH domain-containing protein n=1 Tax=Clostridium butanoliproducens TaxID=2991837 RepID=UPI0024B9BC3D|nr:SPFH domain-containing protein [Clostridium butanoliproducens]